VIKEMTISENMLMLGLAKYRKPHCPDCGYFTMYEKMHEAILMNNERIGGITYFKCPNCGFETNSEEIGNLR